MSFRQILHLTSFAGLALTVAAHSGSSGLHRFMQKARKLKCEKKAPLVCNFQPTTGNSASGHTLFTPNWHHGRCLVRMQCAISGLSPQTQHGWHIHAYGDVSLPNGTATGGHFRSPHFDSRPHGLPNERERHWGDLGNLQVNEQGITTGDTLDSVISLSGIVGRGMIVHALQDEGNEVQPTGGSGARLAQCVIGCANPSWI